MADAIETPSGRESSNASTRRSAANGAARRSRQSASVHEDDLEAQVAQLQSDLKTITQTLTRMGEHKVDEVRTNAKHRAQDLAGKGQSAIDAAQDEFGAIEKQIKDTIRERPLTAVAGALAAGFLIAVLTR